MKWFYKLTDVRFCNWFAKPKNESSFGEANMNLEIKMFNPNITQALKEAIPQRKMGII